MAALQALEAPGPETAEFIENFDGVSQHFELLDKVGEGTFSMVFRAVDKQTNDIVAVKRIHATSSPARIRNELEILSVLHDGEYICSVITAMRCRDQVLLVMPYIEFTDFRYMYDSCSFDEMRVYMTQLLKALAFTAERGVIHRDVKPTNFLYNRETQKGLLVDFGLAEFELHITGDCACAQMSSMPKPVSEQYQLVEGGYLRDDGRPSRRANRAGTRGFRAPEVLLKCGRQTHKIDVWAAGVVLLMMLAKKFPFFQSLDDADALVEIASIYGRREMRAVANFHGAEFETNLPSISENRRSWTSVIDWCNDRHGDKRSLSPERAQELEAIDLLNWLMELDAHKRPSAIEALDHPFLAGNAAASELSSS